MTAIEVVAGIDLSGALAIVTGGYSGLGTETVAALVGTGATVIVPARRPEARVWPGRESRLATNHLGHYVLANLLWPALHRDGGARMIALSSTGTRSPASVSTTRSSTPATTSGRPMGRRRPPTAYSRSSSTGSAPRSACAPSPCIPVES